MKFITRTLVVGLMFVAGVALAAKATDPTVKAWQELMDSNGGAAKTLGGMASGEAAFDAAAAEAAKAQLIANAADIPVKFMTQAADPESKASPDIWKDWDEFAGKAKALGDAAAVGVGFLAFDPAGQSFESYFRLSGQPRNEQYLRFLMGVAPRGWHRAYLADDTRVDLAAQRGPSTVAACELCAGMVATQALKLLLGRGNVPFAPTHVTMDAYLGRAGRTRLRWGMAGPWQRVKLTIARRVYTAMASRAAPPASAHSPSGSVLHDILDAARWAPSGDNVQPWRFEILSHDHVRIRLTSEAATNPYEYRNGEPTLLSGGMLLESLAIAASAHGRALQWSVAGNDPWVIDATITHQADIAPDPLLAMLPLRSVSRGSLGRRPLTDAERIALTAALGPDLTVTWFQSPVDRFRFARLAGQATAIRLRAAETFAVHRTVVDWDRPRSPHGLPSGAIGLNRPTLAMMRWGMASWDRMQRINKVLGTGGASAQLDLLPGLNSSAFFAIRASAETTPEAGTLLRYGRHLQRFWLTASRLGMGMQPALATLIFADHGVRQTRFTTDPALLRRAEVLGASVKAMLGPVGQIHFLGRIGPRRPGLPGPRSIRRPLTEMTVDPAP